MVRMTEGLKEKEEEALESFPVFYETFEGVFSGEALSSATGLTLSPSRDLSRCVSSYVIPWRNITAIDGPVLSHRNPSKLAIECVPVGAKRPLLVKLFVPKLTHFDALLNRLSSECLPFRVVPRQGKVPSFLHSRFLLPYYSPFLRKTARTFVRFYRLVLSIVVLLRIVDIAASLSPFHSWMMSAHVYFASLLSTLPWLCGFFVLVFPFSVPLALLLLAVATSALLFARECSSLLLSLSFLSEARHFISLHKQSRKAFAFLRAVVSYAKPKKKFN